jgi:hypothetical protein
MPARARVIRAAGPVRIVKTIGLRQRTKRERVALGSPFNFGLNIRVK